MEIKISNKYKKLRNVDWDWSNSYKRELENRFSSEDDFGTFDNSNKKVCVMFSGGYDSTALLIDNLEKGYEVYPIEILFNEEDGLIKKIIIHELKKRYKRLHKLTTIANLLDTHNQSEFERVGWNQQPLCGFFCAFIPNYILKEVDEIQLAYVVGDAAISYLDNLKSIYKNAIEFKMHRFKIPELTFPFTKRLHEENVDLVNEHNLPCYAGDGTVYFKYGKKELKNSDKYYIVIEDEIETDSLNKSGNINKNYLIEITYNKESYNYNVEDTEEIDQEIEYEEEK